MSPYVVVKEGTVSWNEQGDLTVQGWGFEVAKGTKSSGATLADMLRAIADYFEAEGRVREAARVREKVS